MRRTVFFLIFFVFVSAKTIVVGNCEKGDENYNSIKTAVSNADNGDTIKICPGTYYENDIEITQNDLVITASTNNRSDVKIISTRNRNIFYTSNWHSGIVIKHLTLEQRKNRSAFFIDSGDDITFEDLNITSKKYGIIFYKEVQNINITDSVLDTRSYSIYCDDDISKDFNVTDTDITTEKDGIYFDGQVGYFYVLNSNIDSTDGDYGIYVRKEINGLDLESFNIKSYKDAVYLGSDVNTKFNLKNGYLNSDSYYAFRIRGDVNNGGDIYGVTFISKKTGIDFYKNAYGDINVSKCYINSSDGDSFYIGGETENLYLNDSELVSSNYYGLYTYSQIEKVDIENCKIHAYKDGIRFNGDINNKTVLKHNCIKSDSRYGLRFYGHVYGDKTVENNCFYADAGTTYLAYSDYDTVICNQNYWDGVSGSYNNDNKIIDNNPWKYCKNNCITQILVDYKMDECTWDLNLNTYEIENYGVLGSDYNATAGNDANVTKGKLCNGGDLNSTDVNDKYVLGKNEIPLPDDYTLNLWIKFPLSFEGHKKLDEVNYYFNIADRPGSNYDYIFFTYDTEYSAWYLCVNDNSNSDCKEFNPNSYSGWHMLTFNVSSSNEETEFYFDGEEKLTFDTYPTGRLGLLFNSDYKSNNDNQPNGQSIGSDVDEFELYGDLLDSDQIKSIYDNENNGKNYDGTERTCPNCNNTNQKSSIFNAVDYIPDITQCSALNDWDDNITTKLVNKEFNLTLLAKDPDTDTPLEANITKVTLYYYDSSSNGQCSGNLIGSKVICDNCGQTNANGCMTLDESTLNVDRAVKCVEVNIQGRALSNTSTDVNESNSTDNFAVRPYKFVITNIPSKIKAGNDFNITIKAVDINGNPVKDYNETVYVNGQSVDLEYNETKKGCKTGTLSKISGGDFINGEANVTLKYNEVGDLNLTVKEINGSEYALVDNDDTNAAQRYIQSVSDVLNFAVDHFKLSALFENYDKDGNFTYYDRDLNISSHLELNITAVDKDGNVLSNYNKECYAKNITVDIAHNSVDVNVSQILYKYIDTNGTEYDGNVSKDENITFVYNKNNFTTDNNGSTRVDVYFNFDRNSSVPLNPFEYNITVIDVNDSDANGTLNLGETARYYYGNLLLSDVLAVQNDFNKTYYFVVYDDNGLLKPDTKELVYDWFINDRHNIIDGNVTDSQITVSKDFNASDTLSGVSVSVVSISGGKITFKISRTDSNVNYAVIHLLSPNLKWLWYSKFYEKYDVSGTSTCLNHFCFAVSWQNTNNEGEVGSGKFNGTEANVTDTNSTKRGVKIFR